MRLDWIKARLGMVVTPSIDHLTTYRAKVQAQSADLRFVDVKADDPRIGSLSRVPILLGLPGATVDVATGCYVRVGWRGGDPRQPYATSWESGATVTKLVLDGTTVYLGAESGAQFVALSNLVGAQLDALKTAISGWTPVPNDGGAALKTALTALFATWPGSVAATKVKAK